MTITLTQLKDQRLGRLEDVGRKLRENLKSIAEGAATLNHPTFPVKDIKITLADHGESIVIAYRRVSVELVGTLAMSQGVLVGKVTARLVSHPLIKDPVVLGSFIMQRTGETDLIGGSDGEKHIDYVAAELAMTALEMGICYDPAPIAKAGGVFV